MVSIIITHSGISDRIELMEAKQIKREEELIKTIETTNLILHSELEDHLLYFNHLSHSPCICMCPEIQTMATQNLRKSLDRLTEKLLRIQLQCEEMREIGRIEQVYCEIIEQCRANKNRKERDEAEYWLQEWGYFETGYEKTRVCYKNVSLFEYKDEEISKLMRILAQRCALLGKEQNTAPECSSSQINKIKYSINKDLCSITKYFQQPSDYLSIYFHYLQKIQYEHNKYQQMIIRYKEYFTLYSLLTDQYESLHQKYEQSIQIVREKGKELRNQGNRIRIEEEEVDEDIQEDEKEVSLISEGKENEDEGAMQDVLQIFT